MDICIMPKRGDKIMTDYAQYFRTAAREKPKSVAGEMEKYLTAFCESDPDVTVRRLSNDESRGAPSWDVTVWKDEMPMGILRFALNDHDGDGKTDLGFIVFDDELSSPWSALTPRTIGAKVAAVGEEFLQGWQKIPKKPGGFFVSDVASFEEAHPEKLAGFLVQLAQILRVTPPERHFFTPHRRPENSPPAPR